MTSELIEKARACKNAEELLALAKENNIEMTAEEAEAKYAELYHEGELSDDELDSAAGGACSEAKADNKVKIADGNTVKINDTSLLEWGGAGVSCVCCCSAFRLSKVSQRGDVTFGKMTCMCCSKLYAFHTEHPCVGEAFTVIN